MLSYIAVFIGGAIGSLFRFILSKFINEYLNISVPLGLLVVNLLGCFLIGFLFGIFQVFFIPLHKRLFIFTGFLGGFTTFSSFELETVEFFRQNHITEGLIYVITGNILGILFIYLGFFLSKVLINKNIL